MRIVLPVPDNRENFRSYDLPKPYFGTASTGLLERFAMLQVERETPGSRMKDSYFDPALLDSEGFGIGPNGFFPNSREHLSSEDFEKFNPAKAKSLNLITSETTNRIRKKCNKLSL